MTKKSCFFGADWLRQLDPGWLLLDLFAANERDELRILVFRDSCAYLGDGESFYPVLVWVEKNSDQLFHAKVWPQGRDLRSFTQAINRWHKVAWSCPCCYHCWLVLAVSC